MRGEVLEGVERRRRWSDEQKLRVLMEIGLRGATVSDVARRHEVTRQQIYSWRQDLKRHGALRPDDRPLFLPIGPPPALPIPVDPEDLGPVSNAVAVPASITTIEIVLCNGRRLCVPAGVDDDALARLIRVVEAS